MTIPTRARRWRGALGAITLAAALGASLLTPYAAQAAEDVPPPVAGLTASNRLGPLASVGGVSRFPGDLVTSAAFPGASASDGIRVFAANDVGVRKFERNVVSFEAAGLDPNEPVTYSRSMAVPAIEKLLPFGQPEGSWLDVYVILLPGGAVDTETPDLDHPSNPTAPYFSSTIVWDGTVWKLGTKPAVEVPKTATTTTISADGTTATSTTLTATVDPAAVSGTISFKNNGAVVGDPVPLVNGSATLAVSGLDPATGYYFGADYSGDATYEASAAAQAVYVETLVETVEPPVEPADTASTEVTVTVPSEGVAEPGGLQISTKPAPTIALSGPETRTEGEAWTATGKLEAVAVKDNRQDASKGAWNLTGTAAGFVSGSNTLPSSNLSWTPVEVGDGPGEAGPASANLSAASTLASGAASAAANLTTTVEAGLSLTVPSGTPAGDYSSTLTLTLI